jgi:hypothetical protein
MDVSIVQNWYNAGLHDVHKARNDRMNGLSTCRQLLEPLAVDGKPGFQVFNTPSNAAFLRTVPDLPYDPANTEDVDTSADDHVYDEWRYAMTLARPRVDRGSVGLSAPNRPRKKETIVERNRRLRREAEARFIREKVGASAF